jgi:hypothetical protein
MLVGMAYQAQSQQLPTRKPARTGYQPRTEQKTTTATPKKVSVEDDPEGYTSVFSFGITTNTNSGLFGGIALKKSILVRNNSPLRQYHYINLELVNVNNPREFSTSIFNTGGSYTVYKENYLFVLRPQYGREFTLFKRSSEGGVQLSGILAAGPSIGLLKPYYVQIQSPTSRLTLQEVPYSLALDTPPVSRIVGSGSFFSGIGQIQPTLGFNVKAGVNIELDAFRNSNIALEIGILAEYFPTAPPILAIGENRKFYSSGYLTLFFGSKK